MSKGTKVSDFYKEKFILKARHKSVQSVALFLTLW